MSWKRGVALKTPDELERMREAGRINALALAAAVSVVRPGGTTAEIDAAAAEVLKRHGAQPAFLGYPGPYPYPAVTTVCVNDELVHGIPGRRRLKPGDIVSIDCGTVLDGFVGDSAVTVAVGQVSKLARKLMDATCQALFAGMLEMRPGRRTGDVSHAIQRVAEGSGFSVVREYTGHGVGRHMHEDPQVPNYGTPGSGLELAVGMTIALEPMVLAGRPEVRVLKDGWTVASADGKLTAHFEHTVAVTEDGPWILTALDDPVDGSEGLQYNEYFAGRLELAGGPVRSEGR
jgi:methionyl aminopeptidase